MVETSGTPPVARSCPWCGYDLRGTEGDACPECGADVRPSTLAKYREGGTRVILIGYWLNWLLPIVYVLVWILLMVIAEMLSLRTRLVLPALFLQPVVGGIAVGSWITDGYRRRAWPGEEDEHAFLGRIVVTVLLQVVLTIVLVLLLAFAAFALFD